MKIINSIEEAKSGIRETAVNGLNAFVVLIPISPRKAFYGINFLHPASAIGSSFTASDGVSKATIIEKL